MRVVNFSEAHGQLKRVLDRVEDAADAGSCLWIITMR